MVNWEGASDHGMKSSVVIIHLKREKFAVEVVNLIFGIHF